LEYSTLPQDLKGALSGKEAQTRDKALVALNKVAAAASMTLDVDEVLRRALALALDVVNAEAGAISVLDESKDELVFRVQQGWRVNDFVAQGVRIPIDQGLSGLAVTSGETVVTGDVSRDPRLVVPEFRDEGVQAMALAPMRARGRVLGVLSAMNYTPRDFSAEEVMAISAIADQIGVALENARLFDNVHSRVQELTALQKVSMQVATTLDLWTVLENIASSTLELTGAAASEMYLYEAEGDRLAFAIAMSRGGERASVGGHPSGNSLVAQAARSGETRIAVDLADSPASADEWRAHGMQSLAALPLKRATHVLGVLAVAFDTPHHFSEHERRILELLAEQAAIAIERTRFLASKTRRSNQLALINKVARQATATLNLSEILDMTATAVRRSFGYFNVALFLVDRASCEIVLRSIAGGHAMVMRRGYRQSIGNGIVGDAADTGQTLLVNDVAQESRYQPIMPTIKPVGSELAVPIVRGDEVIGVLDIRDLERGAFDQEDVRAMETLADQLATAIDNARLHEETQRRVAELTAVQETNLRVVASLDTKEVLDSVAHNVLNLVDADDVHIFLQNSENDGLEFGTALWRGRPSPTNLQKEPDDFTCAVLESNRSLVINHASEHPYFASSEAQDSGVRAIAGFPLVGASGVVGVMTVAYLHPHLFSADELRILGLLASQAATAVTNARLYEETRRRLEEITMLHEVSLAATSTLALEEIADRVVSFVRQSLGVERLDLLLLDEERGVLRGLGSDAAGGGSPLELPVGEGLAGWVAERGAALRIGDVSQDARYVEDLPGMRSALVVPLMIGDRTIGVIYAASPRSDAFGVEDERSMTTVGRQLAVAIENARLYQETDRQLTEVSALYQLARKMSTTLNLQKRLDFIIHALRRTMDCRACSIALLEPTGDVLEIRAAVGIADKWKRKFRLRLGEGVAGRVALEGKPMYVPDTLEMEDFIFFDPSVRSLLTVPLSVQQRVIGTLTVDSDEPNAFGEASERLLTIAAAQAAASIDNARLYARLEQRAKNLVEVCAQLQEADRLKDEMVQNVSHELRTPLTFVKGYIELLLSGEAGPLTEDQREQLRIVVEKTDTVTRLVSDIMFLQQADKLPGKKSPVSLVGLARRALKECVHKAKETELTVVEEFEEGLAPVAGDEGRLSQVFENLLSNALKFSPPGGEIVVKVEDAGAMVRACVSDQGIGIPKDEQERIFERFYQVDGSARRRFSGTGLGLTIARRIVEAHGGRIWVESAPEKGSTFYFAIPKFQAPGSGVFR